MQLTDGRLVHVKHAQGTTVRCSVLRSGGCGERRRSDFLAQRGQTGDAALVLDYYERSLDICEQLLEVNRQSALAARDVSLSLDKPADFLVWLGNAEDSDRALRYYERSLDVRQQLLKANPQSALAARDVSGSLEKLADFLAQRGETGDAERSLGDNE